MSVGTKPCCADSFRALPSAHFGSALCCFAVRANFDRVARFVVNDCVRLSATSALLPNFLRTFAECLSADFTFTRLVRENEHLLQCCQACFGRCATCRNGVCFHSPAVCVAFAICKLIREQFSATKPSAILQIAVQINLMPSEPSS
jgi:hypothetical protein